MLEEPLPQFELPATGGTTFRTDDGRDELLVLYFYPKDNTPGCTTEGQQFRDLHQEFRKAGAVIAGVSRDTMKSHENFKAKMGFTFPLLSDPDETLCRQFDVIRMKKMYGREVR